MVLSLTLPSTQGLFLFSTRTLYIIYMYENIFIKILKLQTSPKFVFKIFPSCDAHWTGMWLCLAWSSLAWPCLGAALMSLKVFPYLPLCSFIDILAVYTCRCAMKKKYLVVSQECTAQPLEMLMAQAPLVLIENTLEWDVDVLEIAAGFLKGIPVG